MQIATHVVILIWQSDVIFATSPHCLCVRSMVLKGAQLAHYSGELGPIKNALGPPLPRPPWMPPLIRLKSHRVAHGRKYLAKVAKGFFIDTMCTACFALIRVGILISRTTRKCLEPLFDYMEHLGH